LIELTKEHAEKLAFLSQASRLMDQALTLATQASLGDKACSHFLGEEDSNTGVNLDFLKWMVSFAWNQGVHSYSKEADHETAKRYF